MMKKDFQLIAEIIKGNDDLPYVRFRLASLFATRLAAEYPRFNKTTFFIACGLDPEDA